MCVCVVFSVLFSAEKFLKVRMVVGFLKGGGWVSKKGMGGAGKLQGNVPGMQEIHEILFSRY